MLVEYKGRPPLLRPELSLVLQAAVLKEKHAVGLLGSVDDGASG